MPILLLGSKGPTRPLSAEIQSSSHSQLAIQNSRSERNLREVNEAKANRRAEIERRCLELDPPLAASVLNHMDSFSAAIQIPHPFTDRDWAILKPRLLSQRNIAERREHERVKHDQLLQSKNEERRQQEAQLKEAKELLDREWDEVQKPIRDRMASYADEIIREGWRGGDGVTKEKCPKFAADVLVYVRDRFYTDLAKNDALARSAGKAIVEDTPNAPPTRKIILENMKWIFDTKIKPLTEQFQKELFLCNGCENNSKFYGFEGVVQHYAAKHTNVLSLGSVVVHWRAEWPEKPPFHPDPDGAKALLYSMPRGISQVSMSYQNRGSGAMYMPGPDHHHMPPETAAVFPHPSPGPYSRTPYGTPYAYGTGPYRPPSPPPPPPPHFYPNQQAGYAYSPPQAGYPSGAPYEAHVQPPPPNPLYGSPYPGQAYPPPYAPPDSRAHPQYPPPPYGPHPPVPGPYGAPYANTQQSRRTASHSNHNSQSFGIHQVQLDEMAKIARSVWNGTSGIRDLPHNIRAYVLIHHVMVRFFDRFASEPPLTLFADGLNSHAQMKPVRNLSGLLCKACNEVEFAHHDGRKMYTLPALVSHFQSIHIERVGSTMHPGPHPAASSWKTNMLVLPDNNTIAELVDAPGMDESKLKLISCAFPWVFPPNSTEERSIALRRTTGPQEIKSSSKSPRIDNIPVYRDGKAASDTRANQDREIEIAVDNFPRFVESPVTESMRAPEPPKDGEYDPHKPSFIEPTRDQCERYNIRYTSEHAAEFDERRTQAESSPRKHHIEDFDSGRDRFFGHSSSNPRPHRGQYVKSEYVQKIGGTSGMGNRRAEEDHAGPRDLSEDGEVEGAYRNRDVKPKATPPIEGMNAAERFLNSFVPGQDSENHPLLSTEAERHFPKSKWHDAPELDDRRWRADAGSSGTAESSAVGTPTRATQHNSWGRRTKSPVTSVYPDPDSRHEPLDNSSIIPPRHGDDRSPDLSDPRYSRRSVVYSNTRYSSDHPPRRPHSRFDRYEAQRQSSHRPRSRSPAVHDSMAMEQPYYRDRSPRVRRQRHAYPAHTEPYHDRVSLEQPVTYTRVPPRAHYQYVDDPRYTVEPPYDVEYIRVSPRERQESSGYYIEQPLQRGTPREYVDYELDYSQSSQGHHAQFYPPNTGAPNFHSHPGSLSRQSRYR